MNKFYIEDLKEISSYSKKMNIKSTILVTGASGMIAKTFIEGITLNNSLIKIIACGRSISRLKQIYKNNKNISYICINDPISNFIRLKFESIIHFASPTDSSTFTDSPVETIDCIYDFTKKMLEVCKEKMVSMIYVSSMEVYGEINNDTYSKEQDLGYIPLNSTRSSYSEGKRMAELLCYSYFKEYKVDVKIARLAQTFGAGTDYTKDKRIFAYIARCIVNNVNIKLSTDGKSIGNYCYLSDAVKGILLIMKKGIKGETYNISNKKCILSIYEMAKKVSKILNKKIKVLINCNKTNIYPRNTKLKIDNSKIISLGFSCKYDIVQMYKRMINL